MTCDCDMPTLYSTKIVKARKPAKCCECGKEIKVGDQYDRADGLWDGEFSCIKTCLDCSKLAAFLRNKYPEETDCLSHGGLHQALFDIDGLIPTDDDFRDEGLLVRANCKIVSNVDWLVRRGRCWVLAGEAIAP